MTLPIGMILTFVIMIYSVGTNNYQMYLNSHAMLLVGGATLSILLFSNPWEVLKNLFRDTLNLFKPNSSFHQVHKELIELAKNKNKESISRDPLIIYAKDLWKQGVPQDLFVVLISQKKQEIEQKSVCAIQCLKNLSKYPPALGMMGTVIGVVSLFQTLGANKDKMGNSLALALTATFYGLVVANALIMPLADRLQIRNTAEKKYLQDIYQILLLINQNELSDLIVDEVELRAS
jgi:chemotaxis protein MotA